MDLALGTYRHTVSTVFPGMTRVAWHLKKEELVRAEPGLTRRRFIYNLSKASYRRDWPEDYRQPGPLARVVALFVRIVPKLGPLKAISFRPPTRVTATMFEESFNRTLTLYQQLLSDVAAGRLSLQNRNFDTGEITRPAEYSLADRAYSELAIRLADGDPAGIDPRLRENVLASYYNGGLPFATKKHRKEWRKTEDAVAKLRGNAAPVASSAVVEMPASRVY